MVIGISIFLFILGGFFLLTKISTFETDFIIETNENSFDIIDDKPQDVKVVEVEKIVEIPVEKIVEKIVEVPVEVIKEIEVDKENNSTVWRNIGLELYNAPTPHHFYTLLDELKNKKVLIVTDSNYVLGANFSDHRVYKGILNHYEILKDRYPDQPSVRFYVGVPVLSGTSISLSWIFDKHKFDNDFSSPKLVADFQKTGIPKNELLLVEA